ncbi:MAG TPA: DUF4190 domain-containing protein [Propionibacterium sp.]|nr:DUF4190 domain-containing protein [Propionibacterium sp.]
MTEPPQPHRPAAQANPYDGTPGPTGTWDRPAYAVPRALPEHPQTSTVLLLGVLGLVLFVTGPFAWVMGSRARAEVAAGRYAPSPLLTAGWALGILTTVCLVVGAIGLSLVVVGVVAFRA